MPSYYRGKRRNARVQREKRIVLLAAAVVLVIVLILILKGCSGTKDKTKAVDLSQTEVQSAAEITPEPISWITAEPTVSPTPTAEIPFAYTASKDPERSQRAITRPVADEGWLPIFKQAETEEKIVAITVDDCFQINNLKEIIQLALNYDGKLTIFPIGEQALRDTHAPVLKAAWEAGMELENHTMTHNGLYNCTDEELAWEVYMQNNALNTILGGEYECHFLRPRGGDARADQRIHAYCKQLNYAGIAHWTYSGKEKNVEDLIEPGAIFLFHCTNKDLEILRDFIPAVAAKGYKMVTLNEMFGYDDNAFTPKDMTNETAEIPALQPYNEVRVEFKLKCYGYGVYKIQERLKELGYLADDPDGIFGNNTAMAVAYFQQAIGEEISGVATVEMQDKLFSDDAPRFTGTMQITPENANVGNDTESAN